MKALLKFAAMVSYVPRTAVESVRRHGLIGARAATRNPELLREMAKAKGMTEKDLLYNIRRHRASKNKGAIEGPNAFFSDIPADVALAENHPSRQMDLVRVRIDIDKLRRDQPDLKMFGMEMRKEEDRQVQGFLKKKEIDSLLKKKPEELWSGYEDKKNVGYYAPNVPHASIYTRDGIIPPEYLKISRR